jgi:uncharacterized membrane protein YfcA
MTGVESFLVLSVAVFFGAFISGLAGFAFSAVAGSVLLHVMQPMEAVPLMMACSIGVQAANVWALRKSIEWRESLVLISGGLLGVPVAVWLLYGTDARTFSRGFGLVVAIYAAYMLFRPSSKCLREMNRASNVLVGFGGGLIGGLTAMPGALPTIWCDIHGVPKNQQRGLVQPFIAVMQVSALTLMAARYDLSSKVLVDLALSLPALLAGSTLGIRAFRKVNEPTFRRITLIILTLSGLVLLM